VIRADVGDIQHGGSILENSHPVFTQATDDRAAGSRTEVSRTHAGLVIQSFTQCGLKSQTQLLLGENSGRLNLLEQCLPEAIAGDDNLIKKGSALAVRLFMDILSGK